MFLAKTGFFTTLLLSASCTTEDTQASLENHKSSHPIRVAIVGAGIAGASAAYYSHKLSHPSQSLSITIYESSSRVGGHLSSVALPKKHHEVVEAGASRIFVDDGCLETAMTDLGLGPRRPYLHNKYLKPRQIGVWDGQTLQNGLACDIESLSWLDHIRLFWRYGLSAWRYHRAVRSTSEKWKLFGGTFDNFISKLHDVGLHKDLVSASAEEYLTSLGISKSFQSEVVQPCTRDVFSHNLADINGLSALMSSREILEAPYPRGNVVDGGNSRLVERMIEASGATVGLNFPIVSISRGSQHHYRLSAISEQQANSSQLKREEFDIVVLAAPLHGQLENILAPLNLPNLETPSPPLFTAAYVTHFTSPLAMSPRFFNSLSQSNVPDDILTVANATNDTQFLSLHIDSLAYIDTTPCLPDDDCDQVEYEYLYRIHTRDPLPDGELSRMISGESSHKDSQNHNYPNDNITWVHRQHWPNASSRFQKNHEISGEIELAPNLFYLGGVEQVLNLMEMSCRVGRNVAGKACEAGLSMKSSFSLEHGEL